MLYHCIDMSFVERLCSITCPLWRGCALYRHVLCGEAVLYRCHRHVLCGEAVLYRYLDTGNGSNKTFVPNNYDLLKINSCTI